MADKTHIEWTSTTNPDGTVTPGATWNPTTGCRKVSPGCDGCYALADAHRMAGNPNSKVSARYAGLTHIVNGRPNWTGEVRCHEDRLEIPLRWRKGRLIFVDSQSDLFHEDVPDEFIDRVFAVMASSARHTFQVLTKRPARMHEYFQRIAQGAAAAATDYQERCRQYFERYREIYRTYNGGIGSGTEPPTPELRFLYDSATRQEGRPIPPDGTTLQVGFSGGEYHWRKWPLSNVWLGVSVEDQRRADERIPLLLQTPAAVRFLSAEPLLGPLDLNRWLRISWQCSGCREYFPAPYQKVCPTCGRTEYWSGSHAFNPPGGQRGSGLNWIIAGGESGPGARPMHPDWPRALRDQCHAAGVPFFFKQWGAWQPRNYMTDDPDDAPDVWDNGEIPLLPDGTDCRGIETLADVKLGCRVMRNVGKKHAGRLLDGREWSEFPEGRA